MIEGMSILAVILAMYVGYKAVWFSTNRRIVLTPVVIFFVIYILYHFPLYFINDLRRWEYLLALAIGLVGFSIGVVLPMLFRRSGRWDFNAVVFRDVDVESSGKMLLMLVVAALALTLAYYKGLPPSFGFLWGAIKSGDFLEAAGQLSGTRRVLTKGHYYGGEYTGQGVFKVFHELAWYLVIATAWLRYWFIRERKPLVIFVVLFFLALFSLYGTGTKAPVAWAFVLLFVVYSYTSKIELKRLFVFVFWLIVVLFILVASQPNRYSADLPLHLAVLETLTTRVFEGNGMNTYEIVVRVIDGEIPIRWGMEHLTIFLNALPGVQYAKPFASELFFILNYDASGTRTTYSTYTYLGSMVLDFGLIGVFMLSIATGYILQKGHLVVCGFSQNVTAIAFGTVFLLKIGLTATSSLVSIGVTMIGLVALYLWSTILIKGRS